MSEPLEYRAITRLGENLAAISVDRGFYHDVEDAIVTLDRAEAAAESEHAPDWIIVEPGTKGERWDYEPASQAIAYVPVTVHWVGKATPPDFGDQPAPPPLERGARMRKFYRVCADVHRAIADDVSLGGIVVDVTVTGRDWNREIDGLDVYASIDLLLKTRRDFTRPGSY